MNTGRYRLLTPLFRRVPVLCVWLGLSLGFARGHSDPWGDVHPRVTVVGDKFRVGFGTNLPDQTEDYGGSRRVEQVMVFNRDGTLFAPRHAVTLKPTAWREWRNAAKTPGNTGVLFESRRFDAVGLRVFPPEGNAMRVRLPWPADFSLNGMSAELLTPQGLAITAKSPAARLPEGSAEPTPLVALKFYWFAHAETGPPSVFTVSHSDSVGDYQPTSNLVFAGGRFWLAFRKVVAQEPESMGVWPWEIAIWSWKPGEKEPRTEILETPTHLKMGLSMAAIGNDLCLAYHCQVRDSTPPWQSRIITVFRKAD